MYYYSSDDDYDNSWSERRFLRDDLVCPPFETFDRSKIYEDYQRRFWVTTSPENVVPLGSYSFAKKSNTIIVPGSPNAWKEPTLPLTLNFDEGFHYTDRNTSLFPEFPMLPAMVAATECMRTGGYSNFNWPSVDFLTDRNALRKLLKWTRGVQDKAWRIDVQLAGAKTLIFNRWEYNTLGESHGYGLSFEKFTSKPVEGCEDANGHYRIITFDYGQLKIVERFEVDAYLPAPSGRNTSEICELEKRLSNMNVGSEVREDLHGLKILKAGSLVPQESLVELMTVRSHVFRSYDWTDKFPQLYLSQTLHVHVGTHVKGKVEQLQKFKLDDAFMQKKKSKMAENFTMLMFLLEKIQKCAVEYGAGKKLSLVCAGGTLAMHAFERDDKKSCLPDDWLKLFDSSK